jgi:hypothetical protein
MIPPPPEPEPGVHLKLYGLPAGAVARVDGVAVDEEMAFVPESAEDYRVEVFDGGERVWAVSHPGNVDGEYEVWQMSESELADSIPETRAEEDAARPTMRRRPRMRPRMALRRGPARMWRRR